jgi:peptide/nickel transport system permease protein
MTSYLIRRTGQILVTLFLFITLAFFLIQAQPGSYASFYSFNPEVPPEARARLESRFGLDRPLWQQYLVHLKNYASGDFGVSFGHYPSSVVDVLVERLPRTVVLFLTATVISFYTGFLLGKSIAWKRGGILEYGATISGALLFTVFTPWFGLMMIWIFAFKLGWFPLGKFLDPIVWRNAPVEANQVFTNMIITAAAFSIFLLVLMFILRNFARQRQNQVLFPLLGISALVTILAWWVSGTGYLALDIVSHMVLPVATLTLISFAGTMLLTRNSMLETIREDFIMVARAKGLPEKVVRDRHAARNALLPVVTSFVFSLAFAIDGSVITEAIFSWPGMGRTLLDAVLTEDLPLAIGAFVFVGIFALIAHLIADILYVYLDPRIRYQ